MENRPRRYGTRVSGRTEDGVQRHVAIKVVPPLLGGVEVEVSRRKRIVAGLRHPNIAQLLDAIYPPWRPCR
jgi:hypothetical protein